jgi:hypothetical protein
MTGCYVLGFIALMEERDASAQVSDVKPVSHADNQAAERQHQTQVSLLSPPLHKLPNPD